MDEKILLIIILISGIYLYNCIFKKKKIEKMIGSVKPFDGIPKKSDYFRIELNFLKNLPIVDSDAVNTAVNLELDNMYVNGKLKSTYDILKKIQDELNDCGTQLNINKEDLNDLKNRKNFIKLIPYMKDTILEKLNYKSIKCFVKKFEPNNLINVIQLINNIPDVFNLRNTMIINDYLYKYTHLGIIKYKINSKYKIDENSNILNASMESTILNDINHHINSDEPVIVLKGEPYKLKKNRVYHLRTKQTFEIKLPKEIIDDEFDVIDDEVINNDNIDDENEIEDENYVEEVQLSKNLSNNISFYVRDLFYINNKLFFSKDNKIFPNEGISLRINNLIKENDLYLQNVIPCYYVLDGKLRLRTMFICNSNLYFYIEDQKIYEPRYFDDDYNFKSTININQDLSCNQYESVLSQLKLSKRINNEIKSNVLKSLKCKFEN